MDACMYGKKEARMGSWMDGRREQGKKEGTEEGTEEGGKEGDREERQPIVRRSIVKRKPFLGVVQ